MMCTVSRDRAPEGARYGQLYDQLTTFIIL